jgi:flagellar basal body-associated protein FliL
MEKEAKNVAPPTAQAEKGSVSSEAIEGSPKAKSKKKSILIFGMTGFVLMAGGFGAAGYLGYIPLPGISHGKSQGPSVVEKQEIGPVVKLGPLTINLKEGSGTNYIKATMVLEIARKDWVEDVQSRMPLLIDTVILILGDKRLEDMKRPDSKEQLKEEFLNKMNEHLKSKKIKRIYFDEFLYQ